MVPELLAADDTDPTLVSLQALLEGGHQAAGPSWTWVSPSEGLETLSSLILIILLCVFSSEAPQRGFITDSTDNLRSFRLGFNKELLFKLEQTWNRPDI